MVYFFTGLDFIQAGNQSTLFPDGWESYRCRGPDYAAVITGSYGTTNALRVNKHDQ